MSSGRSSVPILRLLVFAFSLPLPCLASRTILGAPGGSNRWRHLQQVTLNDVSELGKPANVVADGCRYSTDALHAGYGQVTDV